MVVYNVQLHNFLPLTQNSEMTPAPLLPLFSPQIVTPSSSSENREEITQTIQVVQTHQPIDAREEKSAFPPFKGFMKHSIPICLMVALLKYTLKPSATLAHAENLVPISLLLIGLCTYWAIDGIMKMKNADKSAYFPILNRVVIGSVAISGLSILSLILSIFLQWQVFIIPLLLCWVIFVASVWPLIRYIYRHLRLRIMITHNYFSIKIKNMVTKVSTTQSLTHEMQNPTPMSVVVA